MVDVANTKSTIEGLHTLEKVWFELHREQDACDVLVQMDDGTVYTAMFTTIAYVRRQMDLQYRMAEQDADVPPVRFCAIDTPHIIVEELNRDVLEDTIDNLIAHDVFECHFTRVTQNQTDTNDSTRTTKDSTRATQEITAVVISDVLMVQE